MLSANGEIYNYHELLSAEEVTVEARCFVFFFLLGNKTSHHIARHAAQRVAAASGVVANTDANTDANTAVVGFGVCLVMCYCCTE